MISFEICFTGAINNHCCSTRAISRTISYRLIGMRTQKLDFGNEPVCFWKRSSAKPFKFSLMITSPAVNMKNYFQLKIFFRHSLYFLLWNAVLQKSLPKQIRLISTYLRYSHTETTIIFIIFWDFLTFYQISLSPQVKQSAIISNKHGANKLPHELPNDIWLRILGN